MCRGARGRLMALPSTPQHAEYPRSQKAKACGAAHVANWPTEKEACWEVKLTVGSETALTVILLTACLCVFPFCNIHISHIDVYVCIHHCYWSSAGQTVSSSWTPQRRESAHSSSCLCVSSTWCHCQSQPAGTTPTLNSEPPAFPTPTETERKSKRKRQSKSPESNKSTVKYGMEARDESVFRRRFDWNTWGSVCVCGATLTAGSTATSYFSRMANCSWMGGIWLSILLRSPCRVSRSFRLSPKSGRVWGGWDTLKTHMQPMTLSAW